MKKGVTEFADLTRTYYTANNENYSKYIDNHIFHKYNGIFSHMYNAAQRNGNLVVPFKDKKSEDDIYISNSPRRPHTSANFSSSRSGFLKTTMNSTIGPDETNNSLKNRLNKPNKQAKKRTIHQKILGTLKNN